MLRTQSIGTILGCTRGRVQTQALRLRHDLLETARCIDARANAKPVFDWIYTPRMCVVLHGWLVKGLKGFLACAHAYCFRQG